MPSAVISYPGLSAELVISENLTCDHFFEVVSSCGVFCRMPKAMQLQCLRSTLQSQPEVQGLIFVTDTVNKQKLAPVFAKLDIPTHIVAFENVAEVNDYGLRINQPDFTEGALFSQLIQDHPNYLVIISTPYSCPDLAPYITDSDTLANRSSLFFFEDKRVSSRRFAKETNFIGEIGTDGFEELKHIISEAPETDWFFLKPLGQFTGGNSVLPLNRSTLEQNANFIEESLKQASHYLFKDIQGLNITSSAGVHHGTQFRHFLAGDGEPFGFIIKFSAETGGNASQRSSLKSLSKLFNSSSGTATSVLFACSDTIQPLTLSLSKSEVVTDPAAIHAYLADLHLGKLSLTDQTDLQRINQILLPKSRELLQTFNECFFEQAWDDLYRKFVTDKTYMDPDKT